MPDSTSSQTPGQTTPPIVPPATDTALLNQIVTKMNRSSDDAAQQARNNELAKEYVGLLTPKPASDDSLAIINNKIAAIDKQISDQLNEILHAAEFQKLEASWRGLHYLVTNTETSTMLKLRLLCASQDEVFKNDLCKQGDAEFDQSVLFKKVYEEEYGTFGGQPFGVLLGDYQFTRSPQDLDSLKKIAGLAAAAHAPFIAAAAPALFDIQSFTDLDKPRDLAKVFESTGLEAWHSFRSMEDSRYVTLVLPRFLLRLPYGEKTVPTEGFNLTESTEGRSAVPAVEAVAEEKDTEGKITKQAVAPKPAVPAMDPYLWGNAAWALGLRITSAFARYKWCAAIRGLEGGGKVSDLPIHTFDTGEEKKSPKAAKCPTEIALTDRREKELDTLGFVALCHCKNTDYAAFFGGQTAQKPKKYDTNKANDNATISARLPYILSASRFAHYLKVMCRDKVGSFQTAETLSIYLNRWINQYILGTDDAGQDLKAQYPLREARIDVSAVPGKPGVYRAVVFVRPHFQLEELTASIRLVSELPPPVAA